MEHENAADAQINGYEIWMKQGKLFFESANKNLADLFRQGIHAGQEEVYAKQINQWLESLKKQWGLSQLTEEHTEAKNYWKTMNKMYQDAADLLLTEWMKRIREKNPITNARELYEIWLRCCQEIYEKSLHAKSYQQAYSEWMNMAFKCWKNYMP